MKSYLQLLMGLYGLLLKLYPNAYREEYGEELQMIFDLSLGEAVLKGGFELEKLVLREFFSLPKAILLEHLRERRGANMSSYFASHFNFAPGSRNEILAALAPFLLFGALPALFGYFRVAEFVPLWLYVFLVIILGLMGLSLLFVGFATHFPRWFMPCMGLPMPIISLLLWVSVIEPRLDHLPRFSSWLVSEFVIQAFLWAGLFLVATLLLVSARYNPKSHPFYQRLREDWTLLAFILYGTIPFVLVLVLNEYKNEEPFMFLALLILAAGGWLYLRSDDPWNRFVYLQGGMGLSMFVAAVAKALLVEDSFLLVPADGWQTEFMSTIISWMWLAIFMLLPLAFHLLPRFRNPLRVN